MSHVPSEVERVIDSRAEYLADCIDFSKLKNIKQCRDAVHLIPSEDELSIPLSTDRKIDVLVHYGDDHDHGSGIHCTKFGYLRNQIESLSSSVIHAEAESRVIAALDELEELLDDYCLDFCEISESSALGMFAHWTEERISADCTVYKYRNVEGETHVDLYEFSFCGSPLYIRDYLDAADLANAERNHDAA